MMRGHSLKLTPFAFLFVFLSISISACSPAKPAPKPCTTTADCVGSARCIEGFCAASDFESLAIQIPVAGTRVPAPFTVRAGLMRRTGGTSKPPASVQLMALPAQGEAESTTLGLSDESTATYSAEFSPKQSGIYTLVAASTETGLGSNDVAVVVATCLKACPATDECLDGRCVRPFGAANLLAPAEGYASNTVEVSASLDRTLGAKASAPNDLELVATPVGSATEAERAPLSKKGGADSYSGTWKPKTERAYDVHVYSASLDLVSSSVRVIADFTAPVLQLSVPPPPIRTRNEIDPALKSAFRRDEKVTIRVTTEAADVAPDSFVAETTGIGVGKASPATIAAVPCTGKAEYCWNVQVDLSGPAMAAFNGEFSFEVRVADRAKNASSQKAKLPVTRWRWGFDAKGDLTESVAIGKLGTVYAAERTSSARRMSIYAVNPDGSPRWEFVQDGFLFNIAVGESGGKDRVFVSGVFAERDAGVVWMLDDLSVKDNPKPICTLPGKIVAAMGLTKTKLATESSPVSSVVAIAKNQNGSGKIVTVRPGAAEPCVTTSTLNATVDAPSLALTKGHVYLGDALGKLHSLGFDDSTGEWKARSGFPVALPDSRLVVGPIVSAASVFVASSLERGKGGTLFSVPFVGGSASSNVVKLASAPRSLAQASTRELVVGLEDGSLQLVPESLTGPAKSSNVTKDKLGFSVIGSDGTIYAVGADSEGVAQALSASSAPLWRIELPAPIRSQTIDCGRLPDGSIDKGRPGTLYVAAKASLHAIVVDGAGIDVGAPWPKVHRDPRNSADADRDLTEFSCK
jgi:hypothetical protein